MSERSFFILIAADTPNSRGRIIPANDVVEERLCRGLWPLYSGTRNRKAIREGDVVLMYVAGKRHNAQSIVAEAVVSSNTPVGRRRPAVDPEEVLSDAPEYVLKLSRIQAIGPVGIRPVLNRLSFKSSQSRNWGLLFAGGCRRITSKDYAVIVS